MCQRIKPSRVNQKNILPREYTHASEIRVNIKNFFFSSQLGKRPRFLLPNEFKKGVNASTKNILFFEP